MAAPDQDPTNPHDLAIDAQTDLHKLAAALERMGANPQAVQQLTQMADSCAQIAKVLGQQGPQEQGGPAAPAPPAGPPPSAPPPGPAGPPPGPPGPPPAATGAAVHQAKSIHHASQALHQMMQQSAAARP